MAAHPLVVDPDQQEKLEQIAASERRSPEMLVREAIEILIASRQSIASSVVEIAELDDPLEDYTGPTISYEEFLREGEESSEEFRRTGLHLTHEEVKDWIQRLHDDPNAELPECHT